MLQHLGERAAHLHHFSPRRTNTTTPAQTRGAPPLPGGAGFIGPGEALGPPLRLSPPRSASRGNRGRPPEGSGGGGRRPGAVVPRLGHAAVAPRCQGAGAAPLPGVSGAMTAACRGPDLSFLSEDEARTIFQVLQRDSELRRAEKDRVRYSRRGLPGLRCPGKGDRGTSPCGARLGS